ncbi:MAG: bifunctional tetrahydrofolate synthase/dihydrofolate synthase [Candidatus Endonucleobacter bathymodioli]|uniref:Dihydrofolate synthase/folylpolyglutamate synthase n=1 Tax=Candidatus Endonucleibacter bathymodioli TaxID=539814 RepID=A0AA90NY30_9GAMM|nr:bifunctional tetrahydrofolate synthase/dihydrofolate synthase [Candidatus Endonucleobacter bathymodioli]
MTQTALFDSLPQWLGWLETTRHESEIELDLERIRSVAASVGLLNPAPFIITVAGTNGKGSTVALLESILLAAGYKVGVTSSPHFLCFNERVRINGFLLDDKTLCSAFRVIERGCGATWLTYFEFGTLVAASCFKNSLLDFVILEVGLGGRLDASNVFDSDVAVISTIGFDHKEWLGYSLEAIGREKAGIIREGKPVVYGAETMPISIGEYCTRLKAPLFRRGHAFDALEQDGFWSWSGVSAEGEAVKADKLPLPALELDNAVTVLQVLQFLPKVVDRQAIVSGIKSAYLLGRAQRVTWRNDKGLMIDVMLDVSHNPQSVERLVAKLEKEPVFGTTKAVLAMCSDKDYVSVIDLLSLHIDSWVITEFDSPRALSVEVLVKALERTSSLVTVSSDVVSGFMEVVNESVAGDLVLVTGSFMTVAPVLALLQ